MALIPAKSDGPIVYFMRDGTRIELPIASIYFDNDQIGTTRPNDNASADLLAWLKYLAAEGRVVPGAAPQVPAIVFTAVNAGSPGNRIQVAVTAKTLTTVDITVTATDVYKGLTHATLNATLGTSAVAGTQPGLLRVKSNPNAGQPPAANVDSVPAVAGNPPTWKIGGGNTNLAVLEPRYQGQGVTVVSAADVTVSISEVVAAAGTFTLTVVWSKTIADVAVADLPAKLDPFGAIVAVSAPAGGYRLPQPGTITLSGGSESAVAVPAATTALASA